MYGWPPVTGQMYLDALINYRTGNRSIRTAYRPEIEVMLLQKQLNMPMLNANRTFIFSCFGLMFLRIMLGRLGIGLVRVRKHYHLPCHKNEQQPYRG